MGITKHVYISNISFQRFFSFKFIYLYDQYISADARVLLSYTNSFGCLFVKVDLRVYSVS